MYQLLIILFVIILYAQSNIFNLDYILSALSHPIIACTESPTQHLSDLLGRLLIPLVPRVRI